LGAEGREFESHRPDQSYQRVTDQKSVTRFVFIDPCAKFNHGGSW